MSVHWQINGISACRSPLTLAITIMRATACSHKSRTAPSLLADIAAFRQKWGETDTIEVVDGPCQQQDRPCHCEEACDCYERTRLPAELEAEYARQLARYREYEEGVRQRLAKARQED